MKKIFWNTAVCMLGAVALVACNADDFGEGNASAKKAEVTGKMQVSNNLDQSRVKTYAYNPATRTASYAGYETFQMPAIEAVEAQAATAIEYSKGGSIDHDPWWIPPTQIVAGSSYVVKEDGELGMPFSGGGTLYIYGDVNLKEWGGDGNLTVYVMPGAKVKMQPRCTIYNYGTLVMLDNNYGADNSSQYIEVPENAKVYSKPAVDYPGNEFRVLGTLYAEEGIKVKSLSGNGGTLLTDGTIETVENCNHKGKLVCDKLVASNVYNNGGNYFIGCGSEVSGVFELNGGGATVNLAANTYIKAKNATFASDVVMKMASSSFLDVEQEINLRNIGDNCFVSSAEGFADAAVVRCKSIAANNEDLRSSFKGYFGLDFESIDYANSTGLIDNMNLLPTTQVNGDIQAEIKATSCSPGYKGGGDPTPPGPELEEISSIDTPEHSHDISATCVQFNANIAYVSYHSRGTGTSGCIEAVDMADPANPVLSSFMRSVSRTDFNHLIVDNGVIYATGNDVAKGGVVARIPLVDGLFGKVEGEAEFKLQWLGQGDNGSDDYVAVGDGNCIIRNGDYYQLATTTGFQTYYANDLANTEMRSKTAFGYVKTSGSGKHIASDGVHVVVLNLDERGSGVEGSDNYLASSPATVMVYNQSDYGMASPIATFKTHKVVTPINGKNTVKVVGEYIYVCLGGNGLAVYDLSGNLKSEYAYTDAADKFFANGVDVDEKYVYLAAGNGGVRVLDKAKLLAGATEGVELCKSVYVGGNSANYIKYEEKGGEHYLYVAFGKDELQVYRIKNY